MSLWVVIPAAGTGKRLGAQVPKQYLPLQGRMVIEHTLERMLELAPKALVVALNASDRWWQETSCKDHLSIRRVAGGQERSDSVLAALRSLAGEASDQDWVLVHDVARPCITLADLHKLVNTLKDEPVGGILAAPVSDTIKRVQGENTIVATEDRTALWAAMTPQMFRFGLLLEALEVATSKGMAVTDESAAIEALGMSPRVVMGRRDNLKITRAEDMAIAQAILEFQQKESTG